MPDRIDLSENRYTMHRLLIAFLLTLGVANIVRAQVADAGPDTSLCVTSYTMQGSPLPPGAIGTWSMVSGCNNVSITNAGSPTTNVNFFCTGVCVFMWTVNDNGSFTSDQVVITVYDPNMSVANAGMDQTIVGPQTWAQLSGSPAPMWPATCQWNWVQGSGVVVDPNDPNSIVTGLIVGDNILTWNCENGPCWSSPTVDTVVIQMMMITSLDNVNQQDAPMLTFDPRVRQVLIQQGIHVDALDILDIHGRVVMTRSGNVRSMGLNGLPDGIYLARAIVNGRRQVMRFVLGY